MNQKKYILKTDTSVDQYGGKKKISLTKSKSHAHRVNLSRIDLQQKTISTKKVNFGMKKRTLSRGGSSDNSETISETTNDDKDKEFYKKVHYYIDIKKKIIQQETEMFLPSNSTMLITPESIKKGVIIFELKNGTKYEVECVPIYLYDSTKHTLDWSWNSSSLLKIPEFGKRILDLFSKVLEIPSAITIFKQNLNEFNLKEKDIQNIESMILDILSYLINGTGVFNISYSDEKNPNISSGLYEIFIITKITKIK